ncbi:transposase [uncultured Halopseudomonas sp.]|uniref:transposase n=1 Tax=uncultured Halopseudomonas sp. TaxID=2901193 RepID=UPI0030ECA9A6|tara:strand:- start:1635 stop:1832 length:198 start_codon:yes stop_codon:yes gene_type:complete
MPEMITGKKTQQYSVEFKVKAVEWSHQAHRSVKGVAEALDIHPFMLAKRAPRGQIRHEKGQEGTG